MCGTGFAADCCSAEPARQSRGVSCKERDQCADQASSLAAERAWQSHGPVGCLSAELTVSLRGEELMCGRIFSYRCPTDLFRTLQLSSACSKFTLHLRVH